MLELHVELMIPVAIIFVLMVAFLNAKLYKPMIGFMDDRDETIRKDLEEASNATSNVSQIKKEAAEVIAQAKEKAAAMKNKSVDEAKILAQSKIDSKNEELDQAYEAFKAQMEKERGDLKNALTSELPLFKEALKAKYSQI
ncbi:MAG: FoF1 ATP synthase subunit B' [Campylobacterota bacterium]